MAARNYANIWLTNLISRSLRTSKFFPQTRFLILSSAGTAHRVLTTTSLLEPQTGYTGTDSVQVLLDRFKIVLRPYLTTLESLVIA